VGAAPLSVEGGGGGGGRGGGERGRGERELLRRGNGPEASPEMLQSSPGGCFVAPSVLPLGTSEGQREAERERRRRRRRVRRRRRRGRY